MRTPMIALVSALLLTTAACSDDNPPAPTASPSVAGSDQVPRDLPIPVPPSDLPTPNPSAVRSFALAPDPKATTVAAYIRDLSTINPDIVGGKVSLTVDRGRQLCASIAQFPNDTSRLVGLTNERFTNVDHPNGFGDAVSRRILTVVHTRLCPGTKAAIAANR